MNRSVGLNKPDSTLLTIMHHHTHARTISPIVNPLASAAPSTQRPVSSRFMMSRFFVGPENVAKLPLSSVPSSNVLVSSPMTMRLRGVWSWVWLGTILQFQFLPSAAEDGPRARHRAAARSAVRVMPWADSAYGEGRYVAGEALSDR